jgi:hypothetical protein
MQPLSHGKDAFHRVPNSPQKRFAICHLPFAISGSACLRPLRLCGPCVRIPTWPTSLQDSVLAKWPTPPSTPKRTLRTSVSSCSTLRANTLGARNLAGIAGHARRSNKQTTKESKQLTYENTRHPTIR